MVRARFTHTALAMALIAGYAGNAQADEAQRLQQLEQKLDQSLKLIQQLQSRVAELERPAVKPAEVAAAPEKADTQARLDAVERSVSDIAVAAAKPADTGVPLHGFVDVGWASSSKNKPASTQNGFKLGTFDLYLTPQISERVKGVVELAFEYGEDGGLGTDLERMQLGYVFSDALTLWAGRFHTPYGYWNTAYHHGAQIQTSVTRPRFLAFEDQGGILPAHSVGLWGTGRTRTELGRIQYDAYVVNGDKIQDGILDYNAGGDDNNNHGAGLNVSFSPASLGGLTLGVHALRQRVNGNNSANTASGSTNLQFIGGYTFFETDQWELLGEYYRFNNKDLSGGTGSHRSWAGYAQAGYHIDERWTAYGRAERTSLSLADSYFSLQDSGSSYRRLVAGARFELDPRSALKLEVDRMNDSANLQGAVNTLRTQYAIRF